jgi:predicted membrane protein
MEIIDNKKNDAQHRACRSSRRHCGTYLLAGVFIILGLLFLGRNLGFIDTRLFRIFVSWQMLMVVIGLHLIISHKHNFSGTILIAIGAILLAPKILGDNACSYGVYWPVIFILIGVLILLNSRRIFRPRCKRRGYYYNKDRHFNGSADCSKDGFLNSVTTFGSIKHIILDPVFKGGVVKNSFASTIIDFNHTTLDAEEVYLDVEIALGELEIYAPANWSIVCEVKPTFGGYEDKRYRKDADNIDYKHKLIIRGIISFGGITIS